MNKYYLYIIIAALPIFIIRILPAILIDKPFKNKFIESFLYYVPYVTLALMTFPAIITDSGSVPAGIAAFIIGLILAYKDAGLPLVAGVCCLSVIAVKFITKT